MSGDPFDFVVDKLGGLHNGMARCSAHDDRTRSLSVKLGDDGRVLLKCHAGCTTESVVAAADMKMSDLFARKSVNGKRQIVATYDYTDENGDLLSQQVRYDPKDFRQRRSNGRGGWEYSVKGTRRVLYRLPKVIAAVEADATVYIAEGEKDVEALGRAGVVATCSPQGAGKWATVPDAGSVLAGATVIVVADRDEPGRRHAAEVAADLRGHGCQVTVVEPPAPHKDAADMLGAGLGIDALVPVAIGDHDDQPAPTWSGEPGHVVLDDVHAALIRHVAFPTPEAADAATLFTAATHAQPAWEHATRLVIKSPLKRCGKTRLQELLGATCNRVLATTNISVAALVRSIDENEPPMLMLDEADSIFSKRRGERSEGAEDLRGILNAGHSRGWPYRRWNMSTNTIEDCPTFAMAAISGIGDLPDTIEDRAIVISMRRRAPGEEVAPFRRRRALPPLHALRDRVHAWVRHHLDVLADAEPDMPVEDRAADVWEPLTAIADIAGGDWPERARAACQALTGTTDLDDASAEERLLADLADVFADADKLPTETVLERLHRLAEAPWSDWGKTGKPLNARGLARLLRPYGVRSRNIKMPSGEVPKGYLKTDLHDAWTRYLRPSATAATPLPGAVSPGQPGSGSVADSDSDIRYLSEQELWNEVAEVAEVADEGGIGATPTPDDDCPVCGEGGYDRASFTCRARDCAGF